MPTSTKKAKIHDVFSQQLQLQKDVATSQHTAANGSGQRMWAVLPAFNKDLLDPEAMTDAGFNRDELNTNYTECLADVNNLGTTGDIVSLKQQIDYVAAAERAFRYRHCTPVRALAHSAARRYGLANSAVLDLIQQQAANAIAAGAHTSE